MKRTRFLHKVQNTHGMTLVEILAAITILSIILVTIIGFFTQAANYTARNERKTVAISVAQGAMNYIKQENFDKLYGKFFSFDKKNQPSYQYKPILKVTNDLLKDNYGNFIYEYLDTPQLAYEVLNNTFVNGIQFDANKIQLYIVDYRDKSNFNLNLIDNKYLKEKIANTSKNISTRSYVLHTYVVVEWDSDAKPIILEGVISYENIR